MRPVTALRRCSGTGSLRVSLTASIAALYARPTEFDFGAVARYRVASVSGNIASGMPTKCAACCAATATGSAFGSARPTSSPANDQSTGNEHQVLTRFEHAREPVHRGVGVRAPNGFDEGRNGVVVGVAALVVEQRALLDGILD